MRTLHRMIAAGALAAPLFVAGAGLASADAAYDQNTAVAGPNGAYAHGVLAAADEHGTFFHEHAAAAGPDGAASINTTSWSGNGHHHHDDGSVAFFHSQESYAGPEGAYYQDTTSYAESDDGWDHDDHDGDND